MIDLTTLTYDDFFKNGAPSSAGVLEGQEATADALAAMHEMLSVELTLGWRKWGMPLVRDAVAYGLFTTAMKACGGDTHMSGVAAGVILKRVDWSIVERLTEENWRAYKAYCKKTGEDKGIATAVTGISYRFADGRLPGVRIPGDLYAKMTNTAAPS